MSCASLYTRFSGLPPLRLLIGCAPSAPPGTGAPWRQLMTGLCCQDVSLVAHGESAAQRWRYGIPRNVLLQKGNTACGELRNCFVQIAMEPGERLSFPDSLGVELDEELTMGNQSLLGLFRRRQVVGFGIFFRHPAHLLCLIPKSDAFPLIPLCETGMIVLQDEILWRAGRAADRDCQQRGSLVPVVQMLVLPPLIFRLVAGVSRYVYGNARQSIQT